MDRDLARMADDLVVLVDVRRPEVDEDVDDEHDVDDQVDDRERVAVSREPAADGAPQGRRPPPAGARPVLVVAEEERGDVRREDGRVDDEDEDEPVPDRLERRVVEDGEAVDAR